jgi:hypothetical protein
MWYSYLQTLQLEDKEHIQMRITTSKHSLGKYFPLEFLSQAVNQVKEIKEKIEEY